MKEFKFASILLNGSNFKFIGDIIEDEYYSLHCVSSPAFVSLWKATPEAIQLSELILQD